MKIFWEEEEWKQISEEVFRQRLNHPDLSFVSLVKKAIARLPKDRQREINSLKLCEPIIERVKEKISLLKRDAEKLKKLEGKMAEIETADQILESISDTEAIERFGAQVLRSLTPEELLNLLTTDQILEATPTEELVSVITKRIYQETFQHPVIKEFITGSQEKQPKPVKLTPTVTLPKVICLGMLPNQQSVVQNALKQIADLKFVGSDRNVHSIPSGGDWYVVWTRFSSHNMNDKAKSLAKPGRLILHTGGITNLIVKLQEKLTAKRRIKT